MAEQEIRDRDREDKLEDRGRVETDSDASSEEENSQLQETEESEGRGQRIIDALQGFPDLAYNLFWGVVNLIGKTLRTIVFGQESVMRESADSFMRTMDAERFKAQQPERSKEQEQEAQEQAREAKEDAEASQERKNDDKTEEHTVEEKIQRSGYSVQQDDAIQDPDIIKIGRVTKNGKEVSCFIRESELSGLGEEEAEKYINDAAKYSAAQRYLDYHDLKLEAVGDQRFIMGRQDGPSFSFPVELMDGKLRDAVKEFVKNEKAAPEHSEPKSDDMREPLTIKNAYDPVPPDVAYVNVDDAFPEIRFTTPEELRANPYGNIFLSGYTAEKEKDTDRVRVEDAQGAVFYFQDGDPRLKDSASMISTFHSLERMGVAQGSMVERVPEEFGKMLNNEYKELFHEFGLVAAADEGGRDQIYIFPKADDGKADISVCWKLSQASLYLGDATDLKKVLYEVENHNILHTAGPGECPNDLRAAIEAAGITSALRGSFNEFSDTEVIASTNVELTGKGQNVSIMIDFGGQDSEYGNCRMVYGDQDRTLYSNDLSDFCIDLKDASREFSEGLGNAPADTKIDHFLKPPVDHEEHMVAATIIMSDEFSFDEEDADTLYDMDQISEPDPKEIPEDLYPYDIDYEDEYFER